MDGPTYTVERQTESYVTRYVGMSLFWPPMDNPLAHAYVGSIVPPGPTTVSNIVVVMPALGATDPAVRCSVGR